MTHTTVLVTIGAGRADYVTPQIMPFLHGLSKTGLTTTLEPPAGFTQEDALFSGKHPDTTGRLARFAFDPQDSPFQWLRRFGRANGGAPLRPTTVATRAAVRRVTRWLSPTISADPARVPASLLPFFAPAVRLHPEGLPRWHRSNDLFDLCRRQGLQYQYLAARNAMDDDRVQERLVRDLRRGSAIDLHAVRFAGPEEIGRRHGPHSEEQTKGALRALDDRIASIHAALTAGHESATLVVCGDHGLGQVEREVDVLAALQEADAIAGKDYVAFVHSTLLSVWYLTARGEREVEKILGGLQGATLVDAEERTRRRIPTDRRWGDRLVAAEPGVLFRPDFFHAPDTPIRGMHGYLDKKTEGPAMTLIASTDRRIVPRKVDPRPMVDMFPTLCDLLGLPVPYDQDGSSIVRDGRDTIGLNGKNGRNGHHQRTTSPQNAIMHVER